MPKDYKYYTRTVHGMKKAALVPLLSMIPLLLFSSMPNAFAHEELIVGDIKIVGGWVDEPPLLNQLNGVVLTITRNSTGEPITNAVAQLDVTVQKGSLTKTLDFLPAEEPGTYVGEILPTQVGQYAVLFRGSVAGQEINSQIEIEDVEDTRQFEFPPSQPGSGPVTDDIIEQLQQVITDLNAQQTQPLQLLRNSRRLRTAHIFSEWWESE
jgi:hypothetical protein